MTTATNNNNNDNNETDIYFFCPVLKCWDKSDDVLM